MTAIPADPYEPYRAHLLLDGLGQDGQDRIMAGTALVVGAGGLGSPVLLYLAASGVRRIGIVDSDRVEASNLHRQVLYRHTDVGRSKAERAAEVLLQVQPGVDVAAHAKRLTADNVAEMSAGYDMILDCSDNFSTRFVLCDYAWRAGMPLVSAAALRFEGLLLTQIPAPESACYRCLVPDLPPRDVVPSAREVGVFGPVVGVMGTLQAVEALKVLAGMTDILSNELLQYSGLTGRFRRTRRTRDPACPLCGPDTGRS